MKKSIRKNSILQEHYFLKFTQTMCKIIFISLLCTSTADAQKIAAGWSHSLYLCNNGNTANAWGANAYGQVGDGATADKSLPALVNGLSGIKSIAAGYQHSLALKNDSTLWAWGDNTDGQLGDGTNAGKTAPVKINGLSGVIAMSGGTAGYHSIALKKDGTVWTWGRNTDGQLGDGTIISKNAPVQVSSLTGIIAIAGGEYHSLAIKNDGTVWAWGKNSKGQLGNGTVVNSNVPIQVTGLTGITAITGGRFFSIALKNDSTVWTWGENLYGQLGNGTTIDSNIPVQVTGLKEVTAIAGAAFHCLVIKRGGILLSWGRNTYGNLGNGTTINSSAPVQATGIINVVAIAGGTNYSLAMKTNDSLFAFGRNTNGQLGDGTTVDKYSPTAVLSLCSTPTSVEESIESTLSEMVVFPNPSANGKFQFDSKASASIVQCVAIYNLLGEKIFHATKEKLTNGMIDISNQPNGVYLMTWTSGEDVVYQKLIKQ